LKHDERTRLSLESGASCGLHDIVQCIGRNKKRNRKEERKNAAHMGGIF
jgi:hypothetical protein